MGTNLWRTENVTIGTDPVTFTHGLGVAPAGENGMVFINRRTATAALVITSNSQIVAVSAAVASQTVDILVMAFHSIIK